MNNIGNIYREKGETDKALEYYNKSLNIAKEINNKLLIAASLNNIGGNYDKIDNTKNALKYYEKSLEISREIGNKLYISSTIFNISIIYKNKKDYYTSLKKLIESYHVLPSLFVFEKNQIESNILDIKNKLGKNKFITYFDQILKDLGYLIDINIFLKDNTIINENIKIGRNDLCYCGSQKKYKKCHGNINRTH